MGRMVDVSRWLDGRRAYGAVFIRLFAGIFLIYMSQDNVFSSARMEEFEKFLGQFRFPVPAIAAPVSVYAQFLGGICFLAGVFVRPAAALMTVNFIVALIVVHTKLPFREALDPAAMLASALFLLLHGPGPLSIESALRRRREPRRPDQR
jgi:putative oxidoreductase